MSIRKPDHEPSHPAGPFSGRVDQWANPAMEESLRRFWSAGEDMARAFERYWGFNPMQAAPSFQSFQDMMLRPMQQFQVGGFFAPMALARPQAFGIGPWMGLPPADLVEQDGAYVVTMELPGLTSADIDVEVKDRRLTITGEKSTASDQETGDYHVSERRFGRFQRGFPLSDDCEVSGMSSAVRDGVLTVTIPRRSAKKSPHKPSAPR